MFRIGQAKVGTCEGVRRRDVLKVGAVGVAGLSLADMLRLEAAGSVEPSKAGVKNCIHLFLVGAPSQLDTWDPKPDAPAEIRGPFKPGSTNVPGVHIAEHFSQMRRRAHLYSIIRSVYHKAAPIHETGHQMMQTGYLFEGNKSHPHMGSVVSRLYGARSALPPFVVLPGPIGNTGANVPHGQDAAFLGRTYDPFFLKSNPADPNFKVGDLQPPGGMGMDRVASRRELLKAIDDVQRKVESAPAETKGRDQAYERAFSLMLSPEAKAAFDLNQESDDVRDRYGRNTFGQSCLLARRLIERGVRFVTVNMVDTVFNIMSWDCHSDGGGLNVTLDDYKNVLIPWFDTAYCALLDDLKDRGLLDDTAVVAMGEFGRTPRLNGRGGRDHWPDVWSILTAGGGFAGGRVIGASDKQGAYPKDRPVKPIEVVASIYKAMGINMDETMMPGPGGRPIRLVESEPIAELF
jgi:hypothetical protein